MKLAKRVLILLLFAIIFSGCDFIRNAFDYTNTTKEFVNCLLKGDYDKSLEYMAMEHETAKFANLDTLKAGLAQFGTALVENFGTELKYSLVKSEKNFSLIGSEISSVNTTMVFVQFENEKDFGVFRIMFDDVSKKILNITVESNKKPIPNMVPFWIIAALALAVPGFNLYVIVQIKRSTMSKKWLKYLVVLLLNVPTLTYGATGTLRFDLLEFQFLLGISLSAMGYAKSMVSVGIPLGGLYGLWKLKNQGTPQVSATQTPHEISPENRMGDSPTQT